MKGFEDVTLTWDGVDYVVPATQQMGLIARIEDALSGQSGQQAISVLLAHGGPPYSSLAKAFGSALRYAGAPVTDEEIYLSIMEDMALSKADVVAKVQAQIMALLSIIAPPFAQALRGEPAKK